MQCSNCRFENMPGIDNCGRCGTSLRLATAVIDVHPPRAGRWAKRWSRRFGTRRFVNRLADWVADNSPTLWNDAAIPVPQFEILWRMIVPGWPQIRIGRRVSGRAFLFIYLVAMCVGLIFIGTQLGSMFLGLAFACHAGSILDIVFAAVEGGWTKFIYFINCAVAVTLLAYFPAGWSISRVAMPVVIATPVPVFLQSGDVYLYSRAAYYGATPQAGDVVLYQIPHARIQLPANVAGRYPAIYMIDGERIDRVLATGRQKVVLTGGRLVVDGQASPWLPVNADRIPRDLNLAVTVPDQYCLILPTTNPQFIPGAPPFDQFWSQMSLVPVDNVWGRVYLRSQPLGRLARIR